MVVVTFEAFLYWCPSWATRISMSGLALTRLFPMTSATSSRRNCPIIISVNFDMNLRTTTRSSSRFSSPAHTQDTHNILSVSPSTILPIMRSIGSSSAFFKLPMKCRRNYTTISPSLTSSKSDGKRFSIARCHLVQKIYWLVEDCKRYGTLPFAGLARAGFVAKQLLDSFVELRFSRRVKVPHICAPSKLSPVNSLAIQLSSIKANLLWNL